MTSAATFFPAKLTVPASIDFHVDVNLIEADSAVADAATATRMRTRRFMKAPCRRT